MISGDLDQCSAHCGAVTCPRGRRPAVGGQRSAVISELGTPASSDPGMKGPHSGNRHADIVKRHVEAPR
jgi:hypothetical protein